MAAINMSLRRCIPKDFKITRNCKRSCWNKKELAPHMPALDLSEINSSQIID
jgi:hypothetical protein